MIQLRDRDLGIRDRLRIGERLARVAEAYSQVLCVNDRADLALVLGAQALHLGEASAPALQIREYFGNRFFVMCAAHDPNQRAPLGADAILLSPVCSPRKGAAPLGFASLGRAFALAHVPVFALGGVDAGNARSCIESGATGIAVIGAWLASESLAPLIDALRIARDT
jgi:thiamine-phosphate pyrophosphorylase